MRVGVIVPQGWIGDYDGWNPSEAWKRTEQVAVESEGLGFESLWVYDHFHTRPEPTDELTFESFTTLAAIGRITSRVRLGHLVLCAGFRNPALVSKMISTLDVQTDGRMELGIGAGWKEEEWLAYGYEFGSARTRLAMLEDQLEVLTAMFSPGRGTYTGSHASVSGAINLPKPIQRPRVPVMVGGNGPAITWRLAARYADELNLNVMDPDQVASALPVIADRCREIERDPASLRVSVHVWTEDWLDPGRDRIGQLEAYRKTGISRLMTFVPGVPDSQHALREFASDCLKAGAQLVET